MNRRRNARIGWLGAVMLAGGLVPAQAQAIPYDMQLTPGALRGIAYQPGDAWQYGYWEYLPANFDEFAPGSLPLLVFLPGIGEYDDVSSCPGGTDVCPAGACGGDGLCRNLAWGPQDEIQDGQWDDVLRPFIVVSPQHNIPPFTQAPWDLIRLDDFMQYIVDNYPVDRRRVYLIGMSQGGRATLEYTQNYPRRFTAVAPTPGGVIPATDASCYFQDTALWVFHGENDADGNLGPGVFAPCNMVNVAYQYNNPGLTMSPQCQAVAGDPRPEGRLTMYYNVAHNSWRQTVDPDNFGFPTIEWNSDQGCGIPANFRVYEQAFDPDGVYSWFLSLDRPMVEAPADSMIDQPQTSLTAVVTDDDPIATYEWTQIGGPPVTLNNADTDTLDVSDMATDESYTFQIFVVDADGQWDIDDVTVSTEPMFGGGESSGGGGESTSTGGGGAESTSRGEEESSGGGNGSATTSGGGQDTTEGEGESNPGTSAADTTAGDDVDPSDTQNPTQNPNDSGSGALETSAGPGGMTGDSGDDSPGIGGDAGGCNCSMDDSSPQGWWAWAMVLLAIRRRRSA